MKALEVTENQVDLGLCRKLNIIRLVRHRNVGDHATLGWLYELYVSKALRFRFTLRTCAILLALVCGLLGAWRATQRWGVPEVEASVKMQLQTYIEGQTAQQDYEIPPSYGVENPSVPFPCVVAIDAIHGFGLVRDSAPMSGAAGKRQYYFWFFGVIVKLPYEEGLWIQ